MPFRHLTDEYRNWLIFFLTITWIFSLGMGLWQAVVHHVGPSEDDSSYFLCGAEQGVAQSFFVPLTCQRSSYLMEIYSFFCSSFHIPALGGDCGHQHLHLHEAGVEGHGAGQTGLCTLSSFRGVLSGESEYLFLK